ncbi:MAG: aminoacyl-tRNA hydrolase [Candidatus Paceibacterota bacterium]
MKHIIGLGNPGEKYIGTRHNVGRDFLLWLAEHESFSTWQTDRYAQAQCAEGNIKGEPMLLALPETFMNKSGETVRYLKDKQSLLPEHCILVYDDVDLPVGTFKISTDRGSGGHNGVQSVMDGLGSKSFVRVRIGVARTSFWTGENGATPRR